ncbi:hypothetical protein ACFVYP_39865 [Kitasatospora sp. NPDC058201]|uniref:hypothetical protein n=1 Tax=unclassified Kitasatospora TaxID=2633591 RepID=UPI003669DA06
MSTGTGYRLTYDSRRPIAADPNYGPVRDALRGLINGGCTATLYLWEIHGPGWPVSPGLTVQDWRLVTIANPAPQRFRATHRYECADEPLCGCEPTVPVPPPPHAWCNLFAGLTLSSMFHLHPADRARLTALQWPAPKDAEGWTYPDGATTG